MKIRNAVIPVNEVLPDFPCPLSVIIESPVYQLNLLYLFLQEKIKLAHNPLKRQRPDRLFQRRQTITAPIRTASCGFVVYYFIRFHRK